MEDKLQSLFNIPEVFYNEMSNEAFKECMSFENSDINIKDVLDYYEEKQKV